MFTGRNRCYTRIIGQILRHYAASIILSRAGMGKYFAANVFKSCSTLAFPSLDGEGMGWGDKIST